MENRVDATVDRATCLRTLVVLEGPGQVVFHGCSKRVDKGSGTQLQSIVNGADIIVHFVDRGNVGHSNIETVGRTQFLEDK